MKGIHLGESLSQELGCQKFDSDTLMCGGNDVI